MNADRKVTTDEWWAITRFDKVTSLVAVVLVLVPVLVPVWGALTRG